MVAMNRIQKVGQQIGRQFGAERVILFGSYAQGKATEDSDVDLLVICRFEGKSVDKSVEIRMKLRPQFPVDLLVRSPEKIQQRLQMGDYFIHRWRKKKCIIQKQRIQYVIR